LGSFLVTIKTKNKMQHDNHENPVLSILAGSVFGVVSYLAEHNFMIDFGLDLLKVCLFGFAGGIFGLIGKRFWIKLTGKKQDNEL